MSSIVLASVALLVNSTLQKTQIAAADRTAQEQVRSENAKATTDLIQHLLSNDPARQRLALVALRRAVRDDEEMVVDVVSVVASTAHDDSVFQEAISTLSTSNSAKVARVLGQIALMRSKGREGNTTDAQVAYVASQKVALRASLSEGVAMFYAARPGGVAYDDSALGAGRFTGIVMKALTRDSAEVMSGGVLRIESLFTYLTQSMTQGTQAPQIPMLEFTGAKEVPLLPPATSKVSVLSIGISKYSNSTVPALQYPISDAQSVANFFRARGGKVKTLLNESATRDTILASLSDIAKDANEESTFLLYYSGHGWNVAGEQYIAPADIDIGTRYESPRSGTAPIATERGLVVAPASSYVPGQSISFSEIRDKLKNIKSKHKILFLDACANDPFRSR